MNLNPFRRFRKHDTTGVISLSGLLIGGDAPAGARDQPITRAISGYLARAIDSANIVLERRVGNEWVEEENHPALDALHDLRPAGTFWNTIVWRYLLDGNAYIRAEGTIGGNVGQDTRCWYYRDGWSCYRAGGNICYADTPTAMNREHAILGASRCVAVNPSDTAPVLVALDAEMVVRNRTGERVIPAQDFFIGPAIDITRMTALQPGDVLTSIRIPWTWANTRFYFEKARDRAVWDFPLANVASAAKVSNGVVEDIRIVANGVAPYPVRFLAAEDAVRGRQVSQAVATEAGEIAVNGVRPLRHNAYKVTLLRNLVKRSVQGAEA